MATVGGIRDSDEGSQNSLEIDALARFALDHHNTNQNAVLEFERVVSTKQQVVSGTMHFITMEVKDGGQKKSYEAKIWVKPWMEFKEVQHFKLV